MGVKNVVKKTVVQGWNFPQWLGMGQIKGNAVLIKDLAKATFNPEKHEAAKIGSETFEQAMRRLNMTEKDLQKRIQSSTQIIYFCGLLSIPLLAYTIYIWSLHFYLPSFVCLMLGFLLFAYAFREHFNRFQMRQRRLGCTFYEWFAHTFRLNLLRKK
jgi:intracellular multiplication protein IcmV